MKFINIYTLLLVLPYGRLELSPVLKSNGESSVNIYYLPKNGFGCHLFYFNSTWDSEFSLNVMKLVVTYTENNNSSRIYSITNNYNSNLIQNIYWQYCDFNEVLQYPDAKFRIQLIKMLFINWGFLLLFEYCPVIPLGCQLFHCQWVYNSQI